MNIFKKRVHLLRKHTLKYILKNTSKFTLHLEALWSSLEVKGPVYGRNITSKISPA